MSDPTHDAGTETLAPADEAGVSAIVREAAARREPLEIRGGGSRRWLGRPVQAAKTLSTRGLTGITLYEPGALTVVARAGTPLSEIAETLAAEGQMLPFEPMDHRPLLHTQDAEPTIGGVVACGVAGPRRIQAGGCRDSLIGVRLMNGAGEIVTSGGRVMKNVTGYDLVKLMAGAYGELGVVTEVSFKVLPRPLSVATLILRDLDDARGVDALTVALGSPFDVTGAAHLPARGGAGAETLIRIEGFEDSVAYRSGELRALLQHFGAADIDSDPESAAQRWAAVRDVLPFAEEEGAVWRVSTRPSQAADLVAALAAQRQLSAYYDWGGGLIWLLTPESDDAGAEMIHGEVARRGGDATLVRASKTTRAAVQVFPPRATPIATLSRALKSKFDPAGVLNPGRMAG